ncbi:MAG: hypothetical protein ACE5PM_02860 [Candidatus Hydrothermarchaeales archaeon]
MVNEVRFIFIVAFLAIIVFMIGSHINSKKLNRYAKLLYDKAKDRKVKYAPFGTDGFKARILYEEGTLSQLDLSIRLVDRYNFMHHVLRLYTKDSDTLIVWFRFRDVTKKKLVADKLNSLSPKLLKEEDKRIQAVFDKIDEERLNGIYDAILRI